MPKTRREWETEARDDFGLVRKVQEACEATTTNNSIVMVSGMIYNIPTSIFEAILYDFYASYVKASSSNLYYLLLDLALSTAMHMYGKMLSSLLHPSSNTQRA